MAKTITITRANSSICGSARPTPEEVTGVPVDVEVLELVEYVVVDVGVAWVVEESEVELGTSVLELELEVPDVAEDI